MKRNRIDTGTHHSYPHNTQTNLSQTTHIHIRFTHTLTRSLPHIRCIGHTFGSCHGVRLVGIAVTNRIAGAGAGAGVEAGPTDGGRSVVVTSGAEPIR